MKYSGPKNTAMEYYDFTDGQSITTIKTATKNTSTPSSDVSIGLGKSVYEPEGSMANSTVAPDNMDIDDTDDIGDDEFGSEFQFDLAALKHVEQNALSGLTIMDNTITSNNPTSTKAATMSEADSKAIQEQLTMTLIARNNAAASSNIGESNHDIDVSIHPNFAVVLEDVTNKDYACMLELIDSIAAAIINTNSDEDSINMEIPEQIDHPLFTSPVREALAADLIGSEESLRDYLECMRIAVEDASKVTEGYLSTPDPDIDMESAEDPPLPSTSALESNDSPAKLQGCTKTTITQPTTESSDGVDGNQSSGASRLGADTE